MGENDRELRDKVTVSRHRVARDLFERLTAEPPRHAVAIHEPDDCASVGIDFGDRGYALVHVEVSSSGFLE